MTKKLITLLAAIGMIMPQMASAYDFEVDGIYYNTSGSDATVTYFTRKVGRSTKTTDSYSGIVVIPATVTYNDVTYNVTSIGINAFLDCPRLTSVTIPNSVTNIEVGAFRGCSGLTSITADSGNTHYDSRDNCNAIIETASNTLIAGCKNTIIPNSVTSIGDYAFYGCSGLTSVTIPNSVTSIGDNAFDGCSDLTSVTIPNSVTSIGDYAFSDCTGLTSVTIPNSVTSIGDYVFRDCTSLPVIENIRYADCVAVEPTDKSLSQYKIKGGTRFICSYAFKDCSSLTSITIPNSVTSIGRSAFYGCTSLPVIDNIRYADCVAVEAIDKSLSQYKIRESTKFISSFAFSDCSDLTSITIPNSVTSIGDYAFIGCRDLTSVTIPNNVTSIGKCAFALCSSLTSVTIPNSVTSIGEGAFGGCDGLTSITADSGNTHYDSRDNCNAIIETASNTLIAGCKNTIIPNSVTSIGRSAFYECSGLTSVTIPNSVTSIGGSAFYECSGLTSVTIPNSVTSIGEGAFYDSTGLTSVTIPNSVTSIGDYAFRGCSGLTSVTIPNIVTSIGKYAFYDCDNLRTIISLSVTPPSCFNNTFGSTTYDSAILYVPDTEGTLTLYQTAEAWKNFKNIVANDLTKVNNNRMSAASPTSLINLNGQRITNAQRGISLQQMPDGTTKKVLMR